MSLTNPTKLVNVQELSYFKEKCDAEYIPSYATVAEARAAANELT